MLDSKQRFSADTALNHDFFWTDPVLADLAKMLSYMHPQGASQQQRPPIVILSTDIYDLADVQYNKKIGVKLHNKVTLKSAKSGVFVHSIQAENIC